MQCSSCGTQLPMEVAYCPNCGAVTPYHGSRSEIAPYDLTAVSSPSSAPLQAPPPPTHYGSPPYGALEQNPYEPLNPYAVPLQAASPRQPRRQAWRRPLMVLGSVSGVVLTAFGVIGFFVSFHEATSPLPSENAQALTGFILSGIFLCIGTFIFCKSAAATIGRYIAIFSILVAAVLFITGYFLSNRADALGIFFGSGVIILLGGIFWRGTRTRK